MAPRKGKIRGKRNCGKIKGRTYKQKRGRKRYKDTTKDFKNFDWIRKIPSQHLDKECDFVPNWLDGCLYKQDGPSSSYNENLNEYSDYPNDTDEKYSSDFSYECTCDGLRYSGSKNEIINREPSAKKSVLSNYIRSGMDQVASFIVESAIHFGRQHGVVVPDKKTPNVYQISTPGYILGDKHKKIRFKIPEESLTYEDAMKMMWRRQPKDDTEGSEVNSCNGENTRKKGDSSSLGSPTESLEEILPLLEKLKDSEDLVKGELDLKHLAKETENEAQTRKKRRLKDKIRKMGRRWNSTSSIADKRQEKREYLNNTNWKKFRRDSLELGRQRLKGPKAQKKLSPSVTPSQSFTESLCACKSLYS